MPVLYSRLRWRCSVMFDLFRANACLYHTCYACPFILPAITVRVLTLYRSMLLGTPVLRVLLPVILPYANTHVPVRAPHYTLCHTCPCDRSLFCWVLPCAFDLFRIPRRVTCTTVCTYPFDAGKLLYNVTVQRRWHSHSFLFFFSARYGYALYAVLLRCRYVGVC